MFTRSFRIGWLSLFLFSAMHWMECHCTYAQENTSTKSADTPAAQTDDDGPQRAVYIPYNRLREVFEKDGRGVFLPYSEYQRLWDAAHVKPPRIRSTSPVDALITSADSQAVIEQDVVRVTANLSIELLKKGWLKIPLNLADVAIQSATIDDQPARVRNLPGGGYELIIQHDSDEPKTITLKLLYARAFTKSPGENNVTFHAPPAPVNRWLVRIAQNGVKINVRPFIAAVELTAPNAPAEASDKVAFDRDKETVVQAFVGSTDQVTIQWTPKSEGAAGMEALASVQASQEIVITDSVMRARAMLKYSISRSSLKSLNVDVPGNFKVVNVYDANLRKWEVQQQDDRQRITAELFEPATSQQNLVIELERFLDANALAELKTPDVRAVDVSRQQGTVLVNVDPALRAEARTRTGLLQIDKSELPADQGSQNWTFAYRYASVPYELTLSLLKIQPKITVDETVETYLEPEMLSMDVQALYEITDAGVFQFEFDLPANMTVREVRGIQIGQAIPANVDAYQVSGDANAPKLVVNLLRKAQGSTGLLVRLERRLNDPNLLTPTGTSSSLPLSVPRPNQTNLKRTSGRLLLYTPESLRVNPQDVKEMRNISLAEATANLQSLKQNNYPSTRLAQAFAFGDQPASVSLSAERRKPHITARQRMRVTVEPGVVSYESKFIFDIQYSGVNSLRIDLPQSIAADTRLDSPNMRESVITPQPADVAQGMVAWNIAGQSELIGRHIFSLTWEKKLDELAVGKTLEIELPKLEPKNADITWGQIVISKAETLDVQPTGDIKGLEPIDPQHDVIPEALVTNAARAFEFHDAWTMKLGVTRYELEKIKHTSIERALVRMVLTRSNQVSVQALYRLRSSHQRLTVKLPEGSSFESQPARINGKSIGLERGDKDDLYLPLAGHDPDQSLVLELRYTLPYRSGTFDIPYFPEDPATQKVYINLFVPSERALIAWSGPWNESWTWDWHRQQFLRLDPIPELSDDALNNWVIEGIAIAPSPPFQRDGTVYSFSSLKPEPPPASSLHVTIVNYRFLIGAVLSLIGMVALALLRAPLRMKLVALSAVIIAVVVIGMFAPSFTSQVISLPVITGVIVASTSWLGWYGYRAATWIEKRRSQPTFHPASEPTSSSAATSSPLDTNSPKAEGLDKQAGTDATQDNGGEPNA